MESIEWIKTEAYDLDLGDMLLIKTIDSVKQENLFALHVALPV